MTRELHPMSEHSWSRNTTTKVLSSQRGVIRHWQQYSASVLFVSRFRDGGSSHTGAIAGGVVGGVVGLGLIARFAYFLGTRRSRKTAAPGVSPPPPSELKSSHIPNSPSTMQKPSPEMGQTQVFEPSELEGEPRQVAELPGYYGSFAPGQR
ncbi:uncharacterized protein A1O5_12975 [Cladophialophora psammophila CBS 110553]|uniref:Uncharacterized protein n=1 Tax=Cladophialophora psammophila CBS 110553 TaxID=1182543 RepID=W9VNL8_9EURO|nr:uncharacterized protein A1O5_12975 [Cladophialophora psammophila CBS 110553]EXJ53726.1 hypothetical protein A1O5_12975 [Cladophialophora psammophila CBS 110553]